MPQVAVLFDVDGVLTDSYRPHFLSWQRLMSELDVEFTEENFRATFGRTNPDIFQQLYPGELSAARMAELGERKEVLYREIIQQEFYPMPGAVELVDALAAYILELGGKGRS